MPELSDVDKSDLTETSEEASLAIAAVSPPLLTAHGFALPGSRGFTIRGQVLRKEVRGAQSWEATHWVS